jgi:chromosomal replication initiation ATPase DnaA
MYLCRKITGNSFPSIGEQLGRHHSTVIHAFHLIEQRVNNDSAFRFSIEKIETRIEECASDRNPGSPPSKVVDP